MHEKIINIGILAHVDAGKTTITENLLYKAGQIRVKGSVDSGSSVSDNLEVEKKRGISVKSASTSFEWNGVKINLIDTPGHVDFSSEVERCLRALDGAVLVLSSVEGVQAHTYSLWEALRRSEIPTIIVVNKMDRAGSDFLSVLGELKDELNACVFPMYSVENETSVSADIINLYSGAELPGNNLNVKNIGIENIADLDEEILGKYLEGESLSDGELLDSLKKEVRRCNIFPVITSIAKQDIGTEELLEAFTEFFSQRECVDTSEMSGIVFKVEHDSKLGRLAHIRLFAGSVKSRDEIYNASRKSCGKISQLKKIYTNKLSDVAEICAGDIGVITGLSDVRAGDVLGEASIIPDNTVIQHPVLTVNVIPENPEQYSDLGNALGILNVEDPELGFVWYKKEKELQLNLMGTIQMEILEFILSSRFNIPVCFLDPTVIYKETISEIAIGHARYTMPKPCWAVLSLRIEPGEPGSGYVYRSEVSVDKIARKYQNEIERTIPEALSQGIKGWEVTDLKITLIDGEDHEIHSRPGDFILATPMALMNALKEADTCLLEPIFHFEIKASEEYLGQIVNDLIMLRAEFDGPVVNNGRFVLSGKVPVSTSMDYSIKLNSITGGKGKIRLKFSGYRRCGLEHGKIRKYKGVSPLDESKWILHNRGALQNSLEVAE